MGFIRIFQEDYTPIKLQKDNEKIFQNYENQENISKTHFIKKKQSAINIKRQSGVSYVVCSESKQLNVNHKYEPLGHLVFQGTHSISPLTDIKIISLIKDIILIELVNKPLLISVFESQNENEMKNYLLYPEQRLKITKE